MKNYEHFYARLNHSSTSIIENLLRQPTRRLLFLISVNKQYHEDAQLQAQVNFFTQLLRACRELILSKDYFSSIGREKEMNIFLNSLAGDWDIVVVVADTLQAYNGLPDNDEYKHQTEPKLENRQLIWSQQGQQWLERNKKHFDALKSEGGSEISVSVTFECWEKLLKKAQPHQQTVYDFLQKSYDLGKSFTTSTRLGELQQAFYRAVNHKGWHYLWRQSAHTAKELGKELQESWRNRSLSEDHLDNLNYIIEELALLEGALPQGLCFSNQQDSLCNIIYPGKEEEAFSAARQLIAYALQEGLLKLPNKPKYQMDWLALEIQPDAPGEFWNKELGKDKYLRSTCLLGFSDTSKQKNPLFLQQQHSIVNAYCMGFTEINKSFSLQELRSNLGICFLDCEWDETRPIVRRTQLMHQLADKFTQGHHSRVILKCEGLSGIGKTHLVQMYSREKKERYRHQLLVKSSSKEILLTKIVKLAESLYLVSGPKNSYSAINQWLNESQSQTSLKEIAFVEQAKKLLARMSTEIDPRQKVNLKEALIRECHRLWCQIQLQKWVIKQHDILLVFDDVNDDDVFAYINDFTLEFNGHLLVTSRREEFKIIGYQPVPIGPMEIQEATALLEQYIPADKRDDKLEELAKQLDCIPLFLELAGRYLYKEQLSVSEYLAKFAEQEPSLLQGQQIYHDLIKETLSKKPMYYVLRSILENLAKKSPIITELLYALAHYCPMDIPISLVQHYLEGKYSGLAKEKIEEVIGYARDYYLLREDAKLESLSIHQLVQSTIRLHQVNMLTSNTKQSKVSNDMNEQESVLNNWRNVLLSSGIDYTKTAETSLKYAFARRLVLHLSTIIKYIKLTRISAKEIMNNHHKIAMLLSNIGCELQAKKQLEESISIQRQYSSLDDPQIVPTFISLGTILTQLGDLHKAKENFEKALAIQTHHLTQTDLSLIATLFPLSDALIGIGDYQQANLHVTKALSITKHHSLPVSAEIMFLLGKVSLFLDDYQNAKKHLEKALSLQKLVVSSDHPHLSPILHYLSQVLVALGDYQTAKLYAEQAFSIEEKHFPSDHLRLAHALDCLSQPYLHLGDYQNAQKHLEQALSILKKHLPSNHSRLIYTLGNLGQVFLKWGKYTEAKDYLNEAHSIGEQHFPTNHPQLAPILTNLGQVFVQLGEYLKAKDFFKRALSIENQHLSSGHIRLTPTLGCLGHLFLQLDEYSEAKKYLEEALALQKQYLPPNHLQFVGTFLCLGDMYYQTSEYQQAKYYLEKAKSIQEIHLPSDHFQLVLTLNVAGAIYIKLNENEKAKSCLENALTIEKQHLNPDHILFATTLGHLGELFLKLKQYQIAKNYLEQTLAIEKRHLPHNHSQSAATLSFLGTAYFQLGDLQKAEQTLKQSLAIFSQSPTGYNQVLMINQFLSIIQNMRVRNLNAATARHHNVSTRSSTSTGYVTSVQLEPSMLFYLREKFPAIPFQASYRNAGASHNDPDEHVVDIIGRPNSVEQVALLLDFFKPVRSRIRKDGNTIVIAGSNINPNEFGVLFPPKRF